MSIVQNRIEAAACDIINLTEREMDHYRGSGWKLARFVDGELVGFFDPCDTPYSDNTQAMIDEAIENATAWIANADGEVWLVMCSGGQLCEPRRIALTDAGALARMCRVFAETLADL